MLLKDIPMQLYKTAMSNYPLEEGVDREDLNNAIYNYYAYYKLSFCNTEKWLNNLSARMRIIMPRYNQLYASIALHFDPLKTYDYTRTVDHTGQDSTHETVDATNNLTAKNTQNNTGGYNNDIDHELTANGKTENSTFPQGNLLANGNSSNTQLYLDNATKASNTEKYNDKIQNVHHDNTVNDASQNQTGNQKTDKNTTDSYNDTIKESGTAPGSNYSKLVADYRALAISVEEMIIEELRDLFFSSFDTCDYSDCIPFGVYPWYK